MNQKDKTSMLPKILLVLGLLWICYSTGVHSQIVDYQNKIIISLDDGTQVILYGKAASQGESFSGEFYYLPAMLRLSKRPDGIPEFLFMKYTTEERTDVGGVQGALMHFLMEWGLDSDHEREAQIKLEEKIAELKKNPGSPYRNVSDINIAGAMDVFVDPDKSFRIISATLGDNSSTTVVASGFAPPVPGAKVAVAARLDKNSAQLLATTFEKNRSITDVSIELGFKYNVLFPAVNGKIIIDWTKVQTTFDSLSAEYTHNNRDTKSGSDDRYTYDEARKIYSSLIESKAVVMDIDKTTTDDAVADKIVEGFMNVFIEALADRDMDSPPPPPSEKEKEETPNIRHGESYVFNKTKAERRYSRKHEVYNLNYRVAITKYIPVTGNLGSWYDGVRDNKACVSAVNLNDPFFQHRDINLILDLEAEEMFGKEVNYVTVNVRKKRSQGNDFQDQITIDRNYLKEKGIKASLTYARGEDKNPDAYDYKVQWSLKGGNLYPDDPDWIRGEWEGVTLAPPVRPRKIEFEADLDELKENGITRVTAQIHYLKFGEEVEENIQISPAKKEFLVEKTIFLDRQARGYAYRMVFNHKTEGKLALPWGAQVSDDYIYATIPEELLDTESDVFKTAKEAAENVINSAEEKVLDKFEELFGGK